MSGAHVQVDDLGLFHLEHRRVTSRREFVAATAISAIGLVLPRRLVADQAMTTPPRGFIDLRHAPDAVIVQTAAGDVRLAHTSGDRWTNGGIVVNTVSRPDALHVGVSSPDTAVNRVHLRWHGDLSATRLIVGDAWERGYGDLEWRAWVPDRVMPWYFAMFDGAVTHAYGVRTGAAAFCFWQVDPLGASLWADVRSGGVGVQPRRTHARCVRRRLPRRARRRIVVLGDSRVLPNDVPESAAAAAAGLR